MRRKGTYSVPFGPARGGAQRDYVPFSYAIQTRCVNVIKPWIPPNIWEGKVCVYARDDK